MALSYHFAAPELVVAKLPFLKKAKHSSWMEAAEDLSDFFN